MNWIDERLLNEMKFNHELPELTEICLLLEKLLLFNEKDLERNYLLFSRAELDLLITTINIDIVLLKEQYKLDCKKYTTYDESNFYTMIKPNYKSNRNPNIPLLIATKHLLFSSTSAPAIKIIQNIKKHDFQIICQKIKHCMLVSNIEKKKLYYLDNDYGNKIIEDNYCNGNFPSAKYWRKLYHRRLCIEQYYPQEPFYYFDIRDESFWEYSPYNDYLKSECVDLLPTISLNEYYSFKKRMDDIQLYQTESSSLSPDALLEYLTKFDQLLTASHDIYRLSLNKIIWLNNYGTEYLTYNNPIFLHILFLLLFTSHEDRDAVKLRKAKSSLNIPITNLEHYFFELEKIIKLPSISECIIDKTFYHTVELYKDAHCLFFSNTPSWFKFLILNFDNSHLHAVKLLYYEYYIQRMHLKRTNPYAVLSEIAQQLRLAEEDFDVIYSICIENPLKSLI